MLTPIESLYIHPPGLDRTCLKHCTCSVSLRKSAGRTGYDRAGGRGSSGEGYCSKAGLGPINILGGYFVHYGVFALILGLKNLMEALLFLNISFDTFLNFCTLLPALLPDSPLHPPRSPNSVSTCPLCLLAAAAAPSWQHRSWELRVAGIE